MWEERSLKDPNGRRGKLWFWLGAILFSVSAPIGLIFIVMIAVEPSARTLDVVFITVIPLILTGLGIYGMKRGRKSVSVESVEWSKRDWDIIGFAVGAALIVIGTWGAIILLPAIFNSLLLFALIWGPGVLISYKLKKVRLVLSLGLGVAASGYALVAVAWFGTINYALLIDSLRAVVPPAVLATLAFAWLGRKRLSPYLLSTLTGFSNALFTWMVILLVIVTPFIVGGLHDYNTRGDTSPPQVITLKVVDKWIEYSDDNHEIYKLKGETLDGEVWYSFGVSESFYNEHDFGSLCWISIRSGALGYRWKESYGD